MGVGGGVEFLLGSCVGMGIGLGIDGWNVFGCFV